MCEKTKENKCKLFPQLAQQLVNDILTLKQKHHNDIGRNCHMSQESIAKISHGDFDNLSEDHFDELLDFYKTLFPQALICDNGNHSSAA